ncbi:MAG TPA: redoxin domain-containing protein [Candidatus Binatia bacterium]|nr:redoxin domain-containing protein [Candidatus Binatia bacterium]
MAFAPEFTGVVAWINTKPLKLKDVEGKVVLVDFWTYSCVNCVRTLPHLVATYEKYQKHGLIIIGVHTPEFDFEKKLENVKNAVKDFGIAYPVAVDSDWQIWNAYGNSYWPRQYLLNGNGEIVWDHIGEGGYDDIEWHIRTELEKLGAKLPPMKSEKEEKPGFLARLRTTRETYLGSARSEGFGSASVCLKGSCHRHIDRNEEHDPDVVYLSGDWEQMPEFIEHADGEEGYILQKYTAKEVNLVMAPKKKSCTLVVLLDGKPIPKDFRGEDVDAKGTVTIDSPRMYRLVKSNDAGEHELKLVTKSDGLQAFAFTYG